MLEPGERVEADDIYVGLSPEYIKCPRSFTATEDQVAARKRIGGRTEIIMKRFRHWNCLQYPFKCKGKLADKVEKHSSLVFAVGVLTQLSMEMGIGNLFEVGDEYDNAREVNAVAVGGEEEQIGSSKVMSTFVKKY